MRVLCTGDLHIGRRSSRLPSDVDQRSLSSAAAWDRIVDYATSQQVDVVALSGDVVDEANRYYESLGPLERGLRRLGTAGIATVAVTGNHDYGVLPELARTLPPGYLHLLGVGGQWERTTITKGERRLHVDGWSFPTQHVRENPLATYDLPVVTDAPVLGLLHADVAAPGSAYAPVALADLRARPVALWLLGHVHAPKLRHEAGTPPVLYPGSPQPLDPGEPGVHGIWLVDLRAGTSVSPRHIPLASLRYELLDVDVSSAGELAGARSLIVERVRSTAAELVRGAGPLKHVSLRLRLVGRSAVHRQLEREGQSLSDDLDLEVEGVGVHVERVEVATRPARDLEHLASGSDAAAMLARLLRDLDAGTAELGAELSRGLRTIPATLQAAKPYKALPIDVEELGDGALRDVLARQASGLLDELLAQKEDAA